MTIYYHCFKRNKIYSGCGKVALHKSPLETFSRIHPNATLIFCSYKKQFATSYKRIACNSLMIASYIRQLNKLPLCSEEPGLGVLNIRKEDNKTNVR